MINPKNITILSCLFLAITPLFGQQFSGEKIISTTALGARTVATADIDGDGFQDVVSSNQWASEIVWNRNLGNGTFSDRIVIASLQESVNASVGDIDGDGDMDVVGVSTPQDKIVWYENTDGLGTFASEKFIASSDFVLVTITADIDGDGDLDVVSGADGAGIEWHENLNSMGTSWSKQQIDNRVSRSQAAADIDNDGDLDIIAGTSGDQTVVWYENIDGQGTFGPLKIVFGQALAVRSVIAKDIDGDNDLDIVACTFSNGEVAWYNNEDGEGNFGSKQVIDTSLDGGTKVTAADLDNDNHLDILCTFAIDNTVAWYKNNDGQGSFSTPQILNNNANVARWVIAEDLDNDGDMDVVSASRNDNKVAWYENFEVLGLGENLLETVKLFPNPAKDTLQIQLPKSITLRQIMVLDISGKIVLSQENPDTQNLDVRSLIQGIYFITFSTQENKVTKKLIIK